LRRKNWAGYEKLENNLDFGEKCCIFAVVFFGNSYISGQ